MRTWRRSWQGGVVVAVACLVVGLLRVVAVPHVGAGDGLIWASFGLAISYGYAAVVARPAGSPSRGTAFGVLATVLTKDRIGATVAIAAAVVGLVLVFGDQEYRAERHPAAPPPGQGEPGPSSPKPTTGP